MKKLALSLAICGLAMTMMFAAPASAEDAEVEIKLPRPVFGGTPLDYVGENLEERTYEKRKPFMAPAGTTNLAAGKTVTASVKSTHFGELAQITDGDKEAYDASLVEIDGGSQYIQIDLGESKEIHAIVIWHYHAAERVYFDVVAKISDDPEFGEGSKVVYNNDHNNSSGLGVGKDKEYVETYEGRLIATKGAKGRYVRLYSNGNTSDDTNHYIEVDIYGK